MKTPDEFVQVINRRTDESRRAVKPRKPASIIMTLIFGTFILTVSTVGLMQEAPLYVGLLHSWKGILVYFFALLPTLALMGFAAATLFGCLKRPPWARLISMVFAVAFSAFSCYVLASPNPHPVFQLNSDVEKLSAYLTNVIIGIGMLVYAWSMVFGSKPKAYFADG